MEKNVALIHGAWHGGWCWQGVAKELEAKGIRVAAPTLPGHLPEDDRSNIGLDDYLNKILDVVSKMNGPVTLVGHSSAGFLIQSVAAKMPEKFDHLIFNNAFILANGQCQFDIVPPEVAEGMTQAAAASPDNCVPVMEDFIRGTLMADASKNMQDKLIQNLVPQPLALFTTPIEIDKFETGDFKKTVMYCNQDVSLPDGAYMGMAQSLGEIEIIELALGHEGLFTHPDQFVQTLLEILE
ncbi:MAG: alpha/beta hydrolase [Desulfobacteraceae bacterium]|nr:alpha/beta hydrolase [Desulfobacteraceae bacterium]